MATNPETTLQQLARVQRLRTSMAGVYRYRLSPSLDKRLQYYNPRGVGSKAHAENLLFQYAGEEHRLRQRLQRKQALAHGKPIPPAYWRLRALRADEKTVTFDIAEGTTLVGCAERCDLLLPLPYISRHHLALTTQAGGLRVLDVGSTNGTRVNGSHIERGLLHAGDTLSVAGYAFVLEYCGPMNGVLIA